MAVVLIDGFDHYSTLTEKGWVASGSNGAGSTSISTSAVRTGTHGRRQGDLRNGSYKSFGGTATNGVIGLGFRQVTAITNTYNAICTVFEGGTAHISLYLDSLGRLSVWRVTGWPGTMILGPSASLVSVNVYYYYEMGFSVADSGTVDVYLNGGATPVLTGSGLDTKNGGTGYFQALNLGSWGTDQMGNGTSDQDDIYCLTGTTTPLGDSKVELDLPNGNGNSSQWVGSDGNSTDNYLLVDEVPPSTSDYVESSTPGNKDTYAFSDLATTSGTVHAVQVNPYAAKTDAGSRSIVTVARLSGTEVDGPVRTLGTTYAVLPDIRETKPGGGAWTISDVNSAEFGVKVDS